MRCHRFPWGQGVETAGIKGECQLDMSPHLQISFARAFSVFQCVYDRSQQDCLPLFFFSFLTRLVVASLNMLRKSTEGELFKLVFSGGSGQRIFIDIMGESKVFAQRAAGKMNGRSQTLAGSILNYSAE